MFESIPDYRKIVLLKFLIQNDDDSLKECGFFMSDSNRDVEFAGCSTFSLKLDPADRLLDPAFSEKKTNTQKMNSTNVNITPSISSVLDYLEAIFNIRSTLYRVKS